MSDVAIVATQLTSTRDLPVFQRRARDVADLLGISTGNATRLVAAVAELGRSMLAAGAVLARYTYRSHSLEVQLTTKDFDETLLVDVSGLVADVAVVSDGVALTVPCPMPLDSAELRGIGDALLRRAGDDPSRELERQHEELLSTLSALQRAERLAQQATREQAELLELVPAIVWMAKPDGSWTFVSQRWMERIGELTLASTNPWTHAVTQPSRDEVLRRWVDGIESRVAFAFELALKTADGPSRWHRLRAVPILSGGSIDKWLGVLVDIDDSRQREAQASRVATFMKQMIGVVGHDLRAPLNVATAAAGALRLRNPNIDMVMVERIESNMLRASRMISSLLDYTRAELGEGIPIHRERCDVEVVLRELAEATRTAHPSASIELVVNGETEWLLDVDRMVQAVGNLLENAVAHADLDQPIKLAIAGGAEALEIVVANQGPVIDDEALRTLFEPFRRGRSSRRQGLGLGLYIVAEIARGHGGRATMESDRRGTRARIVIPRQDGLQSART